MPKGALDRGRSKKIKNFIDQGELPQEPQTKEQAEKKSKARTEERFEEKTTATTLRIALSTLKKIDMVLKQSVIPKNRQTYINEAIIEKLKRKTQ